jgi:UDP-N-acetylmuramyl pentapeptide synthase
VIIVKVSELLWSDLPQVLNARVLNEALLTQTPLPANVISTDTRKIQPGCLFFALKGENFDAHDFLIEAQKKGAIGLVIEEAWWNQRLPAEQNNLQAGGFILGVFCVRQALIDFAKAYRSQFQLSVIALTGSCGKTTVKEMIASIFKEAILQTIQSKSSSNQTSSPKSLENSESLENPENSGSAQNIATHILYTEGNLNNDIGVPCCFGE